MGYSPRGHKESDTTERLALSLSLSHHSIFLPLPGSEYRYSIYILLVIPHEVITYMFHSSKSKIDE